AAGFVDAPTALDAAALDWVVASVPGTAAAALRHTGRWSPDDDRNFDGEDWWWRGTFNITGGRDDWCLRIGGLATIADVWLDGDAVLHSDNMFLAHSVDVGALE